ncbi:MAG: chalcone isomerase family protein [Chitinophagales bacterium]|nr:chalcone isomerase family protein [Chitinophagales bacterium]
MKKFFFIGCCSLIFSITIAQTFIEGKTFPNSLDTEKGDLVLNGGGVREKLWIDLYVAGLYLTAKNKNGAEITNADTEMAVRLHIVSSMINSENMSEAINEGFVKSTGGNTAPIKDKIDAFINVFAEPIKVDDIFKLVYLSGEGVKIYKNEVYKSTVSGMDFKKALFGIWLGNTPVSGSLKKGMLGS